MWKVDWYLLLKIVLTNCEKFEAEGWKCKKFWDHLNNSFEYWKIISISETEYFCNLLLEASTYLQSEQIFEMRKPTGNNLEIYGQKT